MHPHPRCASPLLSESYIFALDNSNEQKAAIDELSSSLPRGPQADLRHRQPHVRGGIAVQAGLRGTLHLGRRAQRMTGALDEAAERAMLDAQPHSMTPHVASPQEVLEGLQLERIVQEGIALLDEEHRMLIVLRDVEELSYEEIGQITSLPEGTVKSRLHRARLALKEHMARHTK